MVDFYGKWLGKYTIPLNPNNPWKNEGFKLPIYGFLTPKNESRLWVPMVMDGWDIVFLAKQFAAGAHLECWISSRFMTWMPWEKMAGGFGFSQGSSRSFLQEDRKELSGEKKMHLIMDSILVGGEIKQIFG